MNNNFIKRFSAMLIAVPVLFGSCHDTWKEHYSFKETNSKYPVDKLAETLSNIDGFEKFVTVLSTTRTVDKNGAPLNTTFMDLLSEDQFLTVWAPSNGSVPDSLWAKYTKAGKSAKENQEVAEKFILNHIARFKHSTGEGVNERVVMMSGKAYKSLSDGMGGNPYHGEEKNIRCSNGVLHCIDGYNKYLPSLYEYITTSSDYKELFGDWFKSFTIQELDPDRSVAQGIDKVTGEITYIDSVMIESNRLMSLYGRISTEDSTYALVMPTPALWPSVYNHIKDYYVFAENELNNDSLQQYYTRTTMMTDMFYNMNPKVQRYMPDSVFSTLYSASENRREGKAYHIFGQPYSATGLFGSCVDSVECSNGTIYFMDQWPFADTTTFLRQIKLEAETYQNLPNLILKQQSVQTVGDSTYENPIQVMRISGDGVSNWTGKIYLSDNLKGKYNVKMVMLPNTVTELPNFIHPKISYMMPDGNEKVLIDSVTIESVEYRPGKFRETKVSYYAINNMAKMDTIDLGTIEVPYCNYDMNQDKLSVTLSSGVNEKNSEKYSSEIWLDCIILDPVVE